MSEGMSKKYTTAEFKKRFDFAPTIQGWYVFKKDENRLGWYRFVMIRHDGYGNSRWEITESRNEKPTLIDRAVNE